MNSITETRANILITYMEVKLSSGTVTLGYQAEGSLKFTPRIKLDPYGRETAIGYNIELEFEMLQNDKTVLSELAGYVKNDAAAAVNIYGYTMGNSDGLVQISSLKGTVQANFRAMEESPIKLRFTKVISVDDFYTLWHRSS